MELFFDIAESTSLLPVFPWESRSRLHASSERVTERAGACFQRDGTSGVPSTVLSFTVFAAASSSFPNEDGGKGLLSTCRLAWFEVLSEDGTIPSVESYDANSGDGGNC